MHDHVGGEAADGGAGAPANVGERIVVRGLQASPKAVAGAGRAVAHPGTAGAARAPPPPPPDSSPYLPVSNSQDRRRVTDVLKCSRDPGGTPLRSICKET